MKYNRVGLLFAPAVAVILLTGVTAKAVNVSGTVVLNGITNPFGNLDAATRTYNFVDGLTFEPGARIDVWDHTLQFRSTTAGVATQGDITLNFAPGSGGIDFGTDGILDVMVGGRSRGGVLTFNMNNNNIVGGGSIINCVGEGSCGGGGGDENSFGPPFGGTAAGYDIVMNSDANIQLARIHTASPDASGGKIDIVAKGHVDVGLLNTADTANGGNPSHDINVKANSLRVGDINTGSRRQNSGARNGNVNLTALAPASFDPANAAGNSLGNVLTVAGEIITNGFREDNGNGNVTLTAVKIVLEPTADLDLAPTGTLTMNVGATNLLMNMTNGAITGDATVSVQYRAIPEPGSALLCLLSAALAPLARRRRG